MALDALKHRDVAEIDRMAERLVSFLARVALAIRETAQVNGMLKSGRDWSGGWS